MGKRPRATLAKSSFASTINPGALWFWSEKHDPPQPVGRGGFVPMEVTPPVHNPGIGRKCRRARGRGLCHDYVVHQDILLLALPGKLTAQTSTHAPEKAANWVHKPGGLALRGWQDAWPRKQRHLTRFPVLTTWGMSVSHPFVRMQGLHVCRV